MIKIYQEIFCKFYVPTFKIIVVIIIQNTQLLVICISSHARLLVKEAAIDFSYFLVEGMRAMFLVFGSVNFLTGHFFQFMCSPYLYHSPVSGEGARQRGPRYRKGQAQAGKGPGTRPFQNIIFAGLRPKQKYTNQLS